MLIQTKGHEEGDAEELGRSWIRGRTMTLTSLISAGKNAASFAFEASHDNQSDTSEEVKSF